MRHWHETRVAAVCAATFAAAVIVLAVGCSPRPSNGTVTVAGTLMPLDPGVGGPTLHPGSLCRGHAGQAARTNNTAPVQQSGPIEELIAIYVETGRDFHEPIGPDGYMLRVIPLDRELVPVHRPAQVTIGLFATGPTGEPIQGPPLRVWQVGERSLQDYWVPTRLLDGYLFRLDWGPTALERGRYVLCVRLDDRGTDGFSSVCAAIGFDDFARRYVNAQQSPDGATLTEQP